MIRGLENITERRGLKEVSQLREEMSEMSLNRQDIAGKKKGINVTNYS